MKVVLEAKGVQKFFPGPVPFQVLKDIHLQLHRGEFVALTGKSGCGKSTLLYLLATLDTEYTGEISLLGQKIEGRSKTELASIRSESIGFVFQFHFLLPEFSCLENVMIPALKLGRFTEGEIRKRALLKLEKVGVADQAHKTTGLLSGGQQQRVAIARALINDPPLLLADEPTGNLDSLNTDNVLALFKEFAHEQGASILCVTHDQDFAAGCDRRIEMLDGRIMNA